MYEWKWPGTGKEFGGGEVKKLLGYFTRDPVSGAEIMKGNVLGKTLERYELTQPAS